MTSNFIVDMKLKTLHRLYFIFFAIFLAAMSIAAARYYIIGDGAMYDAPQVLTYMGYGGIILFLIAFLKKEIQFKSNFGYPLVAGIVVLSALSAAFAIDRFTASYGNKGRYEGLLSIIGYAGIFLAASLMYDKKYKKYILDIIILFTSLQSVLGILQSIPALGDIIPSFYKNARGNFLPYVANGVTGSPVFLGALLTIAVGISVVGAIHDRTKARKILYTLATILFVITAFFTNVIQSLIGISAVFITVGIIEWKNKKKNSSAKFFRESFGSFIFILFITAITTATMLISGQARLQDKEIIYQDSFDRAYVTGSIDFKSDKNIYLHMAGEGIGILKHSPLLGTGPDCLTLELYTTIQDNAAQSSDGVLTGDLSSYTEQDEVTKLFLMPTGSIDRPYNEYLYIAMSRGIPCLLVYLAFLIFSLKKGFAKTISFYQDKESWLSVAVTVGVVGYCVQAFVSMSDINVAPYFWLALGFIWTRSDKQAVEQ